MIGYTRARLGDRKGAEAVLAELRDRSADQYVPPFNVAMVYNGLGDADSTFLVARKGVRRPRRQTHVPDGRTQMGSAARRRAVRLVS